MGMLYPKESLFLRIEVGEASDQENTYELFLLPSNTPLIMSKQTGRYFAVSWGELIDMAIEAGIDENGETSIHEMPSGGKEI